MISKKISKAQTLKLKNLFKLLLWKEWVEASFMQNRKIRKNGSKNVFYIFVLRYRFISTFHIVQSKCWRKRFLLCYHVHKHQKKRIYYSNVDLLFTEMYELCWYIFVSIKSPLPLEDRTDLAYILSLLNLVILSLQ